MRPVCRTHVDDYTLVTPARIAGRVLVPSIRAVVQAVVQGADMSRVILARLAGGATLTLEERAPGRFEVLWRFGVAGPRPLAVLDLPALMALDDDRLIALVRRAAAMRHTARRKPFRRRVVNVAHCPRRRRLPGVPAVFGSDGRASGFPLPPMAALRGTDADSLGGRLVAGADGVAAAPGGAVGIRDWSGCSCDDIPFATANPLLVRAHLVRSPDFDDIGRAVTDGGDGRVPWDDAMRPGRWYLIPDVLVCDQPVYFGDGPMVGRAGLRDVLVMPVLRPEDADARRSWQSSASMGALLFNNAYTDGRLCLGGNAPDAIASTPADGVFIASRHKTLIGYDRGVTITSRALSVFAARRLVDAMALTPSNDDLNFASGNGFMTRMGALTHRLPWGDDGREWDSVFDVWCSSGSRADLLLGQCLDALGLVPMARWSDRPGRPENHLVPPACRFYLAQDLFLDEHAPDLDRTHPGVELFDLLSRFWDCLLNGRMWGTGESVNDVHPSAEASKAFDAIDDAVRAVIGSCNALCDDDDDDDDDALASSPVGVNTAGRPGRANPFASVRHDCRRNGKRC